ncbi:MAG: hypothetical protein JOZ25_00305 [Actinobacteria bacterium]|nr:hypothetical protein [Actinomycetota bacterium]
MSAAPDPVRLARALNEAGARYLVIGGFAVIVHQYVRATEDTDLLIPAAAVNVEPLRAGLGSLDARVRRTGEPPTDSELADAPHLRLETSAGVVDLLREGHPPLDFRSGQKERLDVELDGVEIPIAGLPLLTALKRLANRPQDRVDLEELERIHGTLP